MQQIILIFHVLFAIALILLILVQQGKGATMGASFGAGASQTIFGSQGAGSFMMKITAFFALLFFVTSLVLGHMSSAVLPQTSQSDLLSSVEKISQMQKQQQASEQNAAAQAAMQLPENGDTTGLATTTTSPGAATGATR